MKTISRTKYWLFRLLQIFCTHKNNKYLTKPPPMEIAPDDGTDWSCRYRSILKCKCCGKRYKVWSDIHLGLRIINLKTK